MSVKITVKGTTITLPSSGSSPNWSPAILEAFSALANAVNSFAGTYDVAPQVQDISQYNSNSNIQIDNLFFPPQDVRASTIYYTVYRKTSDSGSGDNQEVSESGTLEITYNESRIIEKWEMVRCGQGDAHIDFNITDLGQVTFTTTALTGTDHTGIISYRAICILNT